MFQICGRCTRRRARGWHTPWNAQRRCIQWVRSPAANRIGTLSRGIGQAAIIREEEEDDWVRKIENVKIKLLVRLDNEELDDRSRYNDDDDEKCRR